MQTTVSSPSTRLLVAIDSDDPLREDYLRLPQTDTTRRFGFDIDRLAIRVLQPDQTGDMVRAMNSAVRPFVDQDDLIIGMVNDDHRFRTKGWDKRVAETLQRPGIAYGDDLFQGSKLVCGGVFINAPIVKALGWYCLPSCSHLFVDNAWGVLGMTMDRLTYLPDVVIEHLHPFAGKAEWDDRYEAANNQGVIDADNLAYHEWRDGGQMRRDVERVLRAIA